MSSSSEEEEEEEKEETDLPNEGERVRQLIKVCIILEGTPNH